MYIVLLKPLLGATDDNFISRALFEVYWGTNGITEALYGGYRGAIFITGVPFVVYWGKSCITEVPFWGYRRQFYYWAALLRSVYCGAKLYYCSTFGLTGSNFITGVLFEVYWGTKCITAGDSVIKLDPVAPKGSSVIRYTYNVKL